MTDIYVYCPNCNKEDGKETLCTNVKIILGSTLYKLLCGHIIDKDGLIAKPNQDWKFKD